MERTDVQSEMAKVKNELKALLLKEGEETAVAWDACWLDHSSCPYGFPEGKFNLRPRDSCYHSSESGKGCYKLISVAPELEEMFEKMFAERADEIVGEMKEELREEFRSRLKESPPLSELIKEVSEDVDNQIETNVLQIAAQIIKQSGSDRKVLRIQEIEEVLETQG